MRRQNQLFFLFSEDGKSKNSEMFQMPCSTVSFWVFSVGPKPYFVLVQLLHLLWPLQNPSCSLFHAPLWSWWSQTVSCYKQLHFIQNKLKYSGAKRASAFSCSWTGSRTKVKVMDYKMTTNICLSDRSRGGLRWIEVFQCFCGMKRTDCYSRRSSLTWRESSGFHLSLGTNVRLSFPKTPADLRPPVCFKRSDNTARGSAGVHLFKGRVTPKYQNFTHSSWC